MVGIVSLLDGFQLGLAVLGAEHAIPDTVDNHDFTFDRCACMFGECHLATGSIETAAAVAFPVLNKHIPNRRAGR